MSVCDYNGIQHYKYVTVSTCDCNQHQPVAKSTWDCTSMWLYENATLPTCEYRPSSSLYLKPWTLMEGDRFQCHSVHPSRALFANPWHLNSQSCPTTRSCLPVGGNEWEVKGSYRCPGRAVISYRDTGGAISGDTQAAPGVLKRPQVSGPADPYHLPHRSACLRVG